MTSTTRSSPVTTRDPYVSSVEFLVLGPVEHHADDIAVSLGGPKQRAILGILIANSGTIVSVDSLIAGVWGPDASPSLRSSVHTYISNLRVIIGRSIERIGDGYRLDLPTEAVDALVFEQLVDEAVTARSVNPVRAAELARKALALWRGRPYADVADINGLQNEIRRLDDLRLRAVEARIEADLELGRHRSVIDELEALTTEHPLNEGLHAKLMLALYRDGRQADSLRAFARLRSHLAETLGVEPTPALVELEDRILQHDSTLETPSDTRTEELAFLFTDIEGSTSLWDAQPEWMRVALSRHDAVIAENVERQGGRIFKSMGDGVIAVFTSARQAVDAAAGAQRQLATLDWGVLGPLRVRMAVDIGEVDVRSSDYFGKPMNRGSRLQASAHGGQILLSSSVQEKLGDLAGIQTRNLGEYRLRGLGSPQRVFQLILDGLESDFPDLRVDERSDPDEGRQFGDAIRGYELRERVGVGRFGVVYRAYQPSIGREVAIKVIPPTYSNHPAFIRTFERDARLVAKLAHPHIVPLFDFWRDHAGAYIVMPYITGTSLAAAGSSRLPLSRVSTIMHEIGSALAYAHRHGVVHRDVNPDCILFDGDQNAYLGGFGIGTRALEDEIPGLHSAFSAPEEKDGLPVDERADVFGLGAVATLLITGQPINAVGLEQVPAGDVLARATAPDPDQRYQTIDDLLAALPTDSADSIVEVVARPSRNPFKGLAAFDESDAEDFFGRSEQIGQLLRLVESNRFVTVVGPSGSGKSSLVRAGLLPALRSGSLPGSEDWISAVMLPGTHPFEELLACIGGLATESLGDMLALLGADDNGLLRLVKRVMRDLDGELLLVIDQFEELYTLLSDTALRERFIRSLLEAVSDPHSRLRVVITIRADFFDQPLLDDQLGPVVASTNLAVATPSRTELLGTIEGPAAVAGLELEGGLAERIVEDVSAEPGGLPLMQFTLRALTEASVPGWLTHEKYNAIGGVTGALSTRATEVYDGLERADQLAAQRIMLRLVSVSEENDDVRRRVRRSELESMEPDAGSVDRVLAAFGDARLLTFDRDPATRGPTVEVAHEALLREWQLFRSWVDDRRDDLLIHRRLASAMDEWNATARSEEHLPTGGRLAQFEEWSAGTEIRMTGEELEFLTDAVEHRDSERSKRRRRRQLVLSAFAGVAAVALVLAGVARAQSLRAEGRELIAEAEANLTSDPELSILLALEAVERFDAFGGGGIPARVTDALRSAADADRIVARLPHGSSVMVSGDGAVLVTADGGEGGGTAIVWSTSTFEPIATLEPVGDAEINFVYPRLVGDEMYVGSILRDGSQEVRAWRVGDSDLGERVSSDGYASEVSLWFDASPDDTRTVEVTGSQITVRDRTTGETLFSITGTAVGEAQFLADGRLLFADGPADARQVVIVDATDGTELDRIGPQGVPTESLFASMSPDGDRLAVASQTEIAVFEVADGKRIWARSDRRVSSPVWIDDSEIMLGGEGQLIIVDADTGETRTVLPGHQGGTFSYQPIPGTELLVSASIAGGETLIHRAMSNGLETEIERPIGIVEIDAAGVAGIHDAASFVVLDPTARTTSLELRGDQPALAEATWGFPVSSSNLGYVTGWDDGMSAIWSVEEATWIYHAPAEWSVRGISDDGTEAVISRANRTQVVQVPSATAIGEIESGPNVAFATFTADGNYIVTTSQDPSDPDYGPLFRVWDRQTLELVAGFGESSTFAWQVILTPDGSIAITSGSEGTAYIYDFARILEGADESEALLRTIDAQDTFMVGHDISANGEWVVTTSWEEPARVWDVESGELLGTFGTLEPAVGFHPTEPLLYVAESGELRIYSVETDELIDQARNMLTRTLSPSECERYLHRGCDG